VRYAMTRNQASSQHPPRRPDRRRCSLVKIDDKLVLNNHDNVADDPMKALDSKADNTGIDNAGASEETICSKVEKLVENSITIACNMADDDDHTMISRINPWSHSHLVLTEDQIYAFLHDYHNDYDGLRDKQGLGAWTCFAEEYYDRRSYQFIRPTGNPLDFDAVISGLSANIRIKMIQLVSIDSVNILGGAKSAVVVVTCHHSFEYMGIPNEDRAIMTCVLELIKGEIKIVHEHRSRGRPIPKETRWESD